MTRGTALILCAPRLAQSQGWRRALGSCFGGKFSAIYKNGGICVHEFTIKTL
jgi:hypothetical protein